MIKAIDPFTRVYRAIASKLQLKNKLYLGLTDTLLSVELVPSFKRTGLWSVHKLHSDIMFSFFNRSTAAGKSPHVVLLWAN